MSVGPYCTRCKTSVRLEQDDRSCSNCGAELVKPITAATQQPTPATTKPSTSKPATSKPTATAAKGT